MQKLGVVLERLCWQIELALQLDPEAVELALKELGGCLLAAEPAAQAEAVVEYLSYAGFAGLRCFLEELEAKFQEKGSRGPVLEVIFKSWAELEPLSDEELSLVAVSGRIGAAQGRMRVFDPFELWRFATQGISNPERNHHRLKVATELTRSGPYRSCSFEKATLAQLSELSVTAPNFKEVTECFMDAVNLALRCARPIRITPVLLVGEAGIGKSFYTAELSKCLGVPVTRIAVDNLQIGAGIAGSSYVYSNAEPGELFQALTQQGHISPLMILDEIDKAEVSYQGDPLSPLHNLLEPVSAREFRDASVGIPIDASHVIWIATANYLDKIPSTIKTRFEIFEIASQSLGTKKGILKGLRREFEKEYPDIEHPGIRFTDELLDALVDRTPREQRQLLQRTLARAVRLGDSKVTLEHLGQVAPKIMPQPPKKFLGYL